MRKLNIVHGNLETVRHTLCSYFDRVLTPTQTNVLVDARGHAHLAGLGVAFLSATPGVDINRFFRGAAPELADPRRFGLSNAGTTKASDMYAFGALAWEVSLILDSVFHGRITQQSEAFSQIFAGQARFAESNHQ